MKKKLIKKTRQVPIATLALEYLSSDDVSLKLKGLELREEFLRNPDRVVTVEEIFDAPMTKGEIAQEKSLREGLELARELKTRSLRPDEIDKLYSKELTADQLSRRAVKRGL